MQRAALLLPLTAIALTGCGGQPSPEAATPSAPPDARPSPSASPDRPESSDVPPAVTVESSAGLQYLVQADFDGNAMGQEGILATEHGCIYVELTDDGTRHLAVFPAGTEVSAAGITTIGGGQHPFNETVRFSQFGTGSATDVPAEFLEACGDALPLFGVGP